MKTTVTEALRLKNEISKIVRSLDQNTRYNSVFGQKYVDGVIASDGEGVEFKTLIEKLTTALEISESINSRLSMFNRESGIDSIVRKIQNIKLLISIYEESLPRTKSSTRNTWITVHNERKMVVEEFKPDVTSTEIKDKINELKRTMRALQTEVEKLNQTEIDLSFEYTDIENLTV